VEAEAVDILIREAKFEPDIAIAIAKAIDMSISGANLVTVSLFNERMAAVDARFAQIDVRFAELRGELKEVEGKLIRWVFLTMLGNVALSMAARSIMNALQ
jgi:hypothetical protein